MHRCKAMIVLLALLTPACAAPVPQAVSAVSCGTVDRILRPAQSGWATVNVKLRLPMKTKAAAMTTADIDHYDVRLINVLTGVITASGQVTSQEVQFTQVPDGAYQMSVDAFDGTGVSVVEGGEQWSTNQVTVASPNVTYSGGFNSLEVNLSLKGATGENVATTVNINQGSAWYGGARVGCAPPTDGTWLGMSTMSGNLYTIAGSGAAGFAGDGSPAVAAALQAPTGITLDAASNPIVADQANARIRMVAAASCVNYGVSMTANAIYTVVGGGSTTENDVPPRDVSLGSPRAVAADPDGNLYVADAVRNVIYLVTRKAGSYFGMDLEPDRFWQVVGGGSEWDGADVYRATLSQPSGIALDAARNLYIADTGHHRIRFVPRTDGTFFGQVMAANRIYTIAGNGAPGAAANTPDATTAMLQAPEGVALDRAGNVYVADTGNHVVRMLPKQDGTYFGRTMVAKGLYTIAGNGSAGFSDGGDATSAGLSGPAGLAVDFQGNVLIADTGNNRVRLVPVNAGNYFLQSMTANGLYTVAGGGFGTSSGPAMDSALYQPSGVAVDANGNAYVACRGDQRVAMIMRSVPPLAVLK
jgi:sugar lactone lactonase YvrE